MLRGRSFREDRIPPLLPWRRTIRYFGGDRLEQRCWRFGDFGEAKNHSVLAVIAVTERHETVHRSPAGLGRVGLLREAEKEHPRMAIASEFLDVRVGRRQAQFPELTLQPPVANRSVHHGVDTVPVVRDEECPLPYHSAFAPWRDAPVELHWPSAPDAEPTMRPADEALPCVNKPMSHRGQERRGQPHHDCGRQGSDPDAHVQPR